MALEKPLIVSQFLLSALGTRMFLHHADRIPQEGPVLVVSNHRSFVDAPLLMVATNRSIRFACHRYMSQVPVMREVVQQLGCLPLETPERQQYSFWQKAVQLLQARKIVGIFPEGTPAMVHVSQPQKMAEFQRGFAHLALRAAVPDLAILPVAIASTQETCRPVVPLKLLSLFDSSERLFQQRGWHPMVIYQRVNVIVGRPRWITTAERQSYGGKKTKSLITELSEQCQMEIKDLLRWGYDQSN